MDGHEIVVLSWQGCKDGDAEATSPLCFDGSKAAAAARSAKPLDLMMIANRLDAGKSAPRLTVC